MPQFIRDSVIFQVIWAIGILLVAAIIGWLVLFVMRRVQRRLAQGERTLVISKIIQHLTRPVLVFILIQGLILAISTLPFMEPWRPIFGRLSVSMIILLATFALARVISILLESYLSSRAFKQAVAIDEGLIKFVKRVVIAVIYALGLLILLDYLNVSISPILAGLGIGGLAIALALQPLLSNFFAGSQIVADRIVKVGDYVKLESDNEELEGWVTDIGWRSTRINTIFDTTVVVPNSRLAESIITNYTVPDLDVIITVKSGVTYDSDLIFVEQLVLELAQNIIDERDEADKNFKPVFNYEECGDANINFVVWIKAKDPFAGRKLKSELIKRMRTSFQKEKVETTMITG